MHKELADIIPELRKKYGLRIGQGIPNPRTYYSCIKKSKIVSPRDLSVENTKKYLCHLTHCKHLKKNFKKELCICCKKKYLFKCPDERDLDFNFCLHKNCHGKNTKVPDCSKNCEFVEFLKNTILKQEKKSQKGSSECSESSGSSSNDLGLKAEVKNQNLKGNNRSESYERIRTQKICDSNASEKSADGRPFKSNNINNVLLKKQSNVCYCPNIKSFYLKRIPRENNAAENFLKPKSSSKLIQAEIQPKKISKTSQTENAESETQTKCMCNNSTCLRCNGYQYKTPWLKSCCPAAHSVSCFCFPLGCSRNPAFICPCLFSSNFLHDHFNQHKSKTKKERIKKKETDDELNVKLKINHDAPKVDEKYDLKEPKLSKINDNYLKSNRNIYCVSNCTKTFDRLKYLTDEKLKYYLQQEEIFSRVNHSPSHSGSRLINFCKKDASCFNVEPEKLELKKLKVHSHYRPRHFESSFTDSKMNLQEKNLHDYNTRRFNFSDQAIMTKIPDNDSVTGDKFFKERVESEKSRTNGLDSSHVLSAKAMRKRRKLHTNRKRRKKLAASGKVSFLEYQALLNKLSKGLELINKQVQVKETDSDYFNSKRAIFPTLDTLKSNENNNLKCRNNTFRSERITADTWKKLDNEISSQNLNKLIEIKTCEDALKRPLSSKLQFDGVLQKISCNSGNSWSSSVLKNIVNDLLMDKKKLEQE